MSGEHGNPYLSIKGDKDTQGTGEDEEDEDYDGKFRVERNLRNPSFLVNVCKSGLWAIQMAINIYGIH